MNIFKNKKGAILIQSIIGIAIISFLFFAVIPNFNENRKNQFLKSSVSELFTLIQTARNNAMNSLDSSSYGINFSGNQVTLFKGSSYTGQQNQIIKILNISSPAQISTLSLSGGASSVVFLKNTGEPSVTGSITITSGYGSRVININTLGSLSVYTPESILKNITITKTGLGTISSTPSGINCGATCSYGFDSNWSVTLNALPDTGYSFSGWSGDCSSFGLGACVLTMNNNRNAGATFSVASYIIYANAGAGGSVTPSSRSVTHGGTINFTVTPSSGYSHGTPNTSNSSLCPLGSFSGNTYTTGVVTGTCTYSFNFISSASVPTVTTPTVASVTSSGATLGANVTSLGSPSSISARGTCFGTSPNPTTNCVAQGGTTTGVFTHARTGMSAGTTYYYRGYATNSTGTGYSVDGSFTTEPDVIFVTPSVSGVGGVVSPSGAQEIGPGETQTFTLIPDIGYVVNQSVEGTCPLGYWVGDSYTTGTINSNCSVVFSFESIVYGVEIIAKNGGPSDVSVSPIGVSCNPDCVLKRPYGETLTLTPNPAEGYIFSEWQGDCTGSSGSCILYIDAIKSVNVVFAQDINYNLLISSINVGGVVRSGTGNIVCYAGAKVGCEDSYSENDTVILTATPDSGYAFDSWGDACGGETTNICSVSMTDNKFVEVYFREINFPIVAGVSSSASGSNSYTHNVDLPTSISSGDLLIALFSVDGTPTITWPSGWNQLIIDSQSTNKFEVRYKIADGSEGSSVAVTTSAMELSARHVYRITNFTGVPQATKAKATSQFPNPPILTPDWGNFKNLWISALGKENGGNITISSYPVNYSDGITRASSTGGNGTSVSSAVRYLEASSEDPNSFTLSLSDSWVSANIAIQGR